MRCERTCTLLCDYDVVHLRRTVHVKDYFNLTLNSIRETAGSYEFYAVVGRRALSSDDIAV